MPLDTETTTTATCDTEGCASTSRVHHGKRKAINFLRYYGWSIGQKVLCPKHSGNERPCARCGEQTPPEKSLCVTCEIDVKLVKGICGICDTELEYMVNGRRRCPSCDHAWYIPGREDASVVQE